MDRKISSFVGCFFTVMGLTGLAIGAQGATGGLTFTANSAAGRSMTLNFSQDVVTSSVKSAVVCSEPAAELSLAKLWMPDMGHGSSPTTLVRQDDRCTRVDRLNFLMSGVWELRVTHNDGDTGVFTFDVVE
jgi:hypothetical protein